MHRVISALCPAALRGHAEEPQGKITLINADMARNRQIWRWRQSRWRENLDRPPRCLSRAARRSYGLQIMAA
jgi:hypothetical protein